MAPTRGGRSDDDAHRPRRVGLRLRDARYGRQRDGAHGQMQKSTAGKFHSDSSLSGLSIRSPHRRGRAASPALRGRAPWPVALSVDQGLELALIGPQTTWKSNDLAPTRPMLSAIWIVTLCRPRGSSAFSTTTPEGVGLACASNRLVMSIPRSPYVTRRLSTTILALAPA